MDRTGRPAKGSRAWAAILAGAMVALVACTGSAATASTIGTAAPVPTVAPTLTVLPTEAPTPTLMPTVAPTPTVVDGTWEVSFTEAEMVAAGIADQAEDNEGNYGHFILELHGGGVVLTQIPVDATPPPLRTGYRDYDGTYVIKGKYFLYTTTEATWAYPFTVTSSKLTFGQGGPVTLRAKPWTRIGP